MERHFSTRLAGSAFLQVPHHGSVHSWNDRLLAVTSRAVMPVISAGISNGYRHPHPQVIDALDNTNGGVRWFVSDERNTVAMHIESI
jgi:beta-lactamase superfamily II metal-dependent hydrolase